MTWATISQAFRPAFLVDTPNKLLHSLGPAEPLNHPPHAQLLWLPDSLTPMSIYHPHWRTRVMHLPILVSKELLVTVTCKPNTSDLDLP